jgi:hypothetical protein
MIAFIKKKHLKPNNMTPKEKAEKLVDRFNLPSGLMSIERKQCALIAVDEIWNYVAVIEQHETGDFAFGGSFDGDEYFKYLQEVKQEIESL